jgi:type I pantothenate kinase
MSSRYVDMNRDEWARLRASTPLTLTVGDLDDLRGISDRLDLDEVIDVYLPLSRLLNLYVSSTQRLQEITVTFLGGLTPKVPYVIGIAGSVAVGKSTTARLLQALLSRWPDHPKVDLITTDGFLHPNATLVERGILNRKGFPESYDAKRLLQFLAAVKSGEDEVHAPLYSHVVYDIVDGAHQTVSSPDIVILEGLNILQVGEGAGEFVSDFLDFSIYVDADEGVIEDWYVERFMALRDSVFQDSASYFHRYAELSEADADATARGIWREINGRNLVDNIAPTRERASLILHKGVKHRVTDVRLRKL